MKLQIIKLFDLSDYNDVLGEIGSVSRQLDYHFLPGVRREYSEALLLGSMLPDDFEGKAWVVSEGGQLKGWLCLQGLPWDSAILGYPALKITQLETFNASVREAEDIIDALLDVALVTLRSMPRAHCHLRVPRDNGGLENSLIKSAFKKIENINTYGARLGDIGDELANNKVMPVETRFIESDDIAWARQLSKEAVNLNDRFHADNLLAGLADKFMEAWVDGCTGGFCDSNFIALSEGNRAGFALWQSGQDEKEKLGVQIAKLALGAVSSAFSGRGIHRTLVARGCEHFVNEGADWVLMATQAENGAAIHSMTILGWRLLHREATWSIAVG